jgi:hypothetical protein
MTIAPLLNSNSDSDIAFAKHVQTYERLSRYQEMHMRSLLRILRELEQRQAKRAGEPVAAPEVIEVDVNQIQNGTAPK